MTKRRLFIAGIAFVALGSVTGFFALQNKYYVKKYIKSNAFLYGLARKVVVIKADIQQHFEEKVVLNEPDFTNKEWHLTVDAEKSLGRLHKFWGGLGYESFKDGVLTWRNRFLFKMIKESNKKTNKAFRYIRAHNLFSDGKPPYGEGLNIYHVNDSGEIQYNWILLDEAFDRIVSEDLTPVVELGFMPDALASIPDRRQRWGKANISPPGDYDTWYDLVFNTVTHLKNRYGLEKIRQWYFEVWNEPDLGYLFWIEDPENKSQGDMGEYFKLYEYTARAVKAVDANLHVGGPATAGGYIDAFLEHFEIEKKNSAPIDFVSTHAYGELGYDYRQPMKNSMVAKIFWKIGRAVNHDDKRVQKAIAKKQFVLSEVGPGVYKPNKYNTRYYAAWYAKMVDSFLYLKDSLGDVYVPAVSILWSNNQIPKYFKDEGGVASVLPIVNGHELVVKRPVYNAIELLGYLGNERLQLSGTAKFGDLVHAIATKSGDHAVEIVVYSLNEEDFDFTQTDTAHVNLSVKNLPFNDFVVKRFLIDETHSNSYTAWDNMGRPRKLTVKQAKTMDSKDDLRILNPVQQFRNINQIDLDIDLQPGSVVLFILEKMQD